MEIGVTTVAPRSSRLLQHTSKTSSADSQMVTKSQRPGHHERPNPTRQQEKRMTITDKPAADNGVDVEAILGAREAMRDAREAAQFTWRATNEWVNGVHSRSTVEKFFGVGDEQTHVRAFTFDSDHPELFAAEDNGATPVEYVLVGLAGCLTGGIASVAQNRGVQLNSVRSTLEGDMDLAGILGIDREVRNGYSAIRVEFEIDADASAAEIEAIVEQSRKRSAVYETLANPVEVTVAVKS
jgi:uncharacterized OsmC-like protein